jgi:phosphohistidine swiveling domain-containing protein
MSLILINKDGPEIQKCWERTETTLPFVNVSVQMYGILKEELSFFEEEGFSEAIFFKKNPKEDKTEGWFILSKYNQFINKIKEKIRHDSSYLERLLLKIKVILDEFVVFSSNSIEFEKRINENKHSLIDVARYYYNLSYRSVIAAWSFDIIGWVLMEILEEELRKQNSFSEEKVIILTSYGIKSIILEEKLELLNLIKDNFSESTLKEHYKKWYFIKMATPADNSSNPDFYKIRFEELKNKNIAEEIERIKIKTNLEIKEFNKNLNEIKDKNLLNLIDLTRKFISLKNNERILLHKYINQSLNIPILISKKLGLNYEQVSYISSEEIIGIVNKEVLKEDIERNAEYRKTEGFIFKIKNKKEIISPFIEKDSIILKGLSASKGYSKGKAIIIQNISKDTEKFNRGDILVTSMTTPDFVPLMEKAGAIVTNEGGVLCHAAIVSREFAIPCIVGTENATKILKDGMFIEVDAREREGKVTILENDTE